MGWSSRACERRIRPAAIVLLLTCVSGPMEPTLFGGIARAETAKPFVIKTADGVLLTDPEGRGEPAPAAADLGLVNVIGWGTVDPAGLIALLARSALGEPRTDVTLTIDSRAQKIAHETLTHHLTRVVDDKDKPRKFFKDRRAAILMMDVESGAIVAVGSWPPPPPNAGAADYERLARETPRDDPASIPAWRPVGGYDPAGHAMMPLVALAAALEASDMAARPDERLAAMLLGMDRATYRRRLGIDPAAARLPIAGSALFVENFGGREGGLSGPLRGQACIGDGVVISTDKPNVSLALKHSNSAYFGRLALLLEERAVEAWAKALPKDRAGRVEINVRQYPQPRLAQRLAEIGLDPSDAIDLAANLTAPQRLARLRGAGVLDRLFAAAPANLYSQRVALPSELVATTYRADYNYRIALGGTGEAWALSPLHLALGAATIARGERIRPYLIGGWGDAKLGSPPPAERLALRADLLGAIQLGMKSATEAPGAPQTGVYSREPRFVLGQEYEKIKDGDIGRRVAALRQPRPDVEVKPMWCRTYSKSGTVDGLTEGTNTGWAMGWKEPLVHGGRRLAFACMVTHLDTVQVRFGGAVCGAILRDIQFSLEVMDRPDLRSD